MPTAILTCERAGEPGRVRCTVEASAPKGSEIAWAEVVLVAVPEFTAVLKGRIGRADVVEQSSGRLKWAFGLVARRAGQGTIRVKVRLTSCEGPVDAGLPRCEASETEAQAVVLVGGG